MSLSVLKNVPKRGIISLAEIQTVMKGYGKPLMEEIMRRYPNLWWAADPEGGKSLLEYYRQFEGMKEFKVSLSKWTDTPQSFFYKAEDSAHSKDIVSLLKSFESPGRKRKKNRKS